MGAGASIPETEEEAREQGYSDQQIEEYKANIQKLAMENALKALAARKAQHAQAAADAKLDAPQGCAPQAKSECK